MYTFKKVLIFFMAMLFTTLPLTTNHIRKDNVEVQNLIAPQHSSLISNRYTQVEEDLRVAKNDYIDLDGYEMLGTIGNLSLYVLSDDLSFRLVNNKTGYLWGSNFNFDYLQEGSELADEGDLGANLLWQNRFDSPAVVNYYQKTNIREEYLFENNLSRKTFTKINETNKIGFKSKLTFHLSKVSFEMLVYIDEEGLHFEVPFDSITEGEVLLLAGIKLYPFFGAAKRNRIPGYTFVPDGIGALIRFDDKRNKEVYNKRFYGPDLGLNLTSSEEYLNLNTFGVVQGINQNAYLSVIKSGASHANLTVSPSQTGTDFNYTYVTYEYRKDYIQYLNQSKTSSIIQVQKNKNEFNIKQSYYFLNGADANYVGMANKYKELLINDERLIKTNHNDMPIHFDVLMSESKRAFIGRTVFSMTTVSELEEIVKRLNDENITNLNLTLKGWQSGGYSYTEPKYQSVESKIGGKNQLKEFVESNSNVYLEMDYFKVSTKGSNYQQGDVSQSIGRQLITDEENYFLRPDISLKKYESNLKKVKDLYDGIHLASTYYLYSDFATKKNREQQIEIIKEFMTKTDKTSVSRPFDYLLGASRITDLQLYSSQQNRFSDTVPFLAIVLSGYKDAFGRNSNFFANTSNELLRLVDYHVYPSFYITNESSYYLLNTSSENIYTSRYLDWEAEIIRQYNFVNNALKHVLNASIINREILKPGFVKVTYSNNVTIYINYSEHTYTDGDVEVSPVSYEVIS